MKTRIKLLLAVAVAIGVAPMVVVGVPAQADGLCLPADSGNEASVEMVGEGEGGNTFTCDYTATGRGGISAATPNKWTMVNTRTGATVAAWDMNLGAPAQSTGSAVCKDDVIEITFSSERQPGFETLPSGTYGVIRAGGAGVVPDLELTTDPCDGL